MRVAIDETGQQGGAAAIDDSGLPGIRQTERPTSTMRLFSTKTAAAGMAEPFSPVHTVQFLLSVLFGVFAGMVFSEMRASEPIAW